MNPDVLACLNSDHTATQAYHLVDALDRIDRKEQRLAAILILASVLAEELDVHLPTLLTIVHNLATDSTRRKVPNVEAARRYIRTEILT